MVKKRPGVSSMRGRTLQALSNVKLLPDDPLLREKFVLLVRSVYEKIDEIKRKFKVEVPIRLLENTAILKIKYAFTSDDIKVAMRGEKENLISIVKKRQSEIELLAEAYGQARETFKKLSDLLSSGRAFEELDLRSELLDPANCRTHNAVPAVPLHMARILEATRWSEAFQAGDLNASCRLAEHYIAIGVHEIAESIINDVMLAEPNHAGAWFQRARMLLLKSTAANREASRLHMLNKEGGALSAAETHFQESALDEISTSSDLHRQAFDACVTAYGLLPNHVGYEQSATKWSADYGTLRHLRYKVIQFIVCEAGRLCNPYTCDGELDDRIQARLGCMKNCARRYVPGGEGGSFDWGVDAERTAAVTQRPLFSENIDTVILAVYDELKSSPLIENRTLVQFLALNFLRLLGPPERYRLEVAGFVRSLSEGYAPVTGQYFGAFDGSGIHGNRHKVLHEHLDAIMSVDQQRDLVRKIYTRWAATVDSMRDDALLSIYNDEVRRLFADGNLMGMHRAACHAETEGVYRRDDGWGALVLTRAAEHAARKLGNATTRPESIVRHLEDEAMRRVGLEYYDSLLSADADPENSIDTDPFLGASDDV